MATSADRESDDIIADLLKGVDIDDKVLNVKELDLSNRNLTKLPEHFFGPHFQNLERIDLSKNKLKSLPSRFESNSLTVSHLNVSHNRLTSLPNWMGSLIRLKELSISWNPLEEYNVLNLNLLGKKSRLLRSLEAKNCRFETIPKVFCQNKDLRRMDFGNVDDFLPENDRNVIYDVPSHIVDLVGLVELSLANAFVSKLPENFGELKNLEKLDLHNNQISWLPPSFVLLAKLQVSLI